MLESIIILLVGFFAGCLNTLAGGGSFLVLPVLIFMGLPPVIANATNRVAIVVQNISALIGFKKQGINNIKYSLQLALITTVGTIIGVWLALHISGKDFKKILSILMVLALFFIFKKPGKKESAEKQFSTKNKVLSGVTFFFIGIYGGFIQSGVGFLILTALTLINNFNLVKANSIKVGIISIYTLVAVAIFAAKSKIYWDYAMVLAIGNACGGFVGSYLAVLKGSEWIRKIVILAILVMAIKLSGIIPLLYH